MLAALHLSAGAPKLLASLSDGEWRQALDYCDRGRLTFALFEAAAGALPAWVGERIEADAARNALRMARVEGLYRSIHGWLGDQGIEFAALKGITHTTLIAQPPPRVQYDIDIYVPRPAALRAQGALIEHGWKPAKGMESYPTDHLPVLVPETNWRWRGDYFDPELPIPIEIHFQFWNERLERLAGPGTEQFWVRRTVRRVAGVDLHALNPVDALGYAALHLLRHLLRGSVQPFHVYEIARMLDGLADEPAFWDQWLDWHDPQLRRLEAVVFRLAEEWFGCALPAAAREETDRLPAATSAWFDDHALSPAIAPFHANKDEIWLHFSLLDRRCDRWRVAWRRLFPALRPHSARHALRRLPHHAVSLARTAAAALGWQPLGRQFWWFVFSGAVFNLALFVFVLLYNLYLLDLGFREDFVGTVNGAMRAGSLAGTIPAAFVAHRLGLRRTLLLTIAATAAAEFFRAATGARLPLTALAFLSGAAFSVWAVILAPLVAGAVGEKRRPAAFSVFFACMVGAGIAGNWLGGRLPLWAGGKRAVLLGAAAASAVAILPAWRLREGPRAEAGSPRVWPRGRFLPLYLAPFALWHLATGTFNPFNNVYFARLGFPVQRIGSIFSLAQAVQVGALLAAPAVVRRLGLSGGIAAMMAATAAGLAALAWQPPGAGAAAAYIAYMTLQWMSEPGLNTLLMNHVPERERSGACALTFLVAFGAQAIAAFAAGGLFTRFGYGWTLAASALLVLAAAGMFRTLLRFPERPASGGESAPG